MSDIIKIDSLVKKYGSFTAVNNISFNVTEGSLFAFLGPNGAGKSTTINILSTVLDKDSGRVEINGYELGKQDFRIKMSIGIVFQNSVLDKLLTVKENIDSRAAFYGLKGKEYKRRFDFISEAIGLKEFINKQYGSLSGGQRRRADIARALVNSPSVLFLDEPTTGLDPQSRINVWDTVTKMRKEYGTTVFLTTHYMEEAAEADDIAIIDGGKIVARGTPNELKDKYSSDKLKLQPIDRSQVEELLKNEGMSFEQNVDVIEVEITDSMSAIPVINKLKPYITGFEVIKGNMDSVFLKATGHSLVGGNK